jgi:AcrR family transcriptional regulator
MLSTDNHTTRDRSLRAAVQVVRDAGIHELTTRAIARRSGLTQPAIYRHFAGKQELVREVMGEVRELFFARLSRAGGEGGGKDRLISALEVFRDFAIEEPRLYDALFLQTADSGSVAVAGGRGGNILGVLVDRVAECGREGSLRSGGPVAMALSLAAHAQGLVLLYRQGRFGSSDRFSHFYRRSIEDLLAGMKEGDEGPRG